MPEETALAKSLPVQQVLEKTQSSKLSRLAAFTPTNLTEAMTLAKMIAQSELAPKEYRGKPGNVLIGMQYAAELGIPPVSGLQNISIINGRACLWGDLFLGIIQASPDYEWHTEKFEGEGDNFGAVCTMKRKGSEPHTVKFTVADAKTAKLWGKRGYNGQDTPWVTNPKRMLQSRARGFCGRDKFSDALKGLIIAEEAMDMPPDLGRETAVVDAKEFTGAITQSSEPNRGHGAEGMVVSPQAPPVEEKPKKQENEMCGSCGKVNGHEEGCKFAAPAGLVRKPVMIQATEIQTGKNKAKRLVVTVLTDDQPEPWKLYCYHKTPQEFLETAKQGILDLKLSEKDGKQFYQVENIVELDGVPYQDNKPAPKQEPKEQESASPSAGELGFDPPDPEEEESPR